ncbi:delta-60 repeat domain-containing protein [uncultured Serinicoccus sp.]|uniref:delta-60 repeat domain-containing protein n=1 Tax=uncultured Serinicoccus sp. TaxID=735514 RepID=UPI0026035F2E|nr:delta-60 repeat domain-containing protein [uncultured Serinicoccus sp.]
MADLLATLGTALGDCLRQPPPPGLPPLPTSLAALGEGSLDDLSVGTDPRGPGVDRWWALLRSKVTDVAVRETLAVRALQLRLPRVAEALTLLGVVEVTWEAGGSAAQVRHLRLRWDRLRGLTQDPGPVALTALAGRVNGLGDVQSLQVLLLLLLGDPGALLRLEYARQGFTALPTGDGSGLGDLVAIVNSPVYLPLPAGGLTRTPPATGVHLVATGPDLPLQPGDLGDLAVAAVLPAGQAPTGPVTLAPGWQLVVEAAGGGQTRIALGAGGDVLDPAVRSSGPVGVHVTPQTAPGADAFLVGDRGGTHVGLGQVRLGVVLRSEPETPLFTLLLSLGQVRLALGADVLGPVAGGLPLPPAFVVSTEVRTAFLQGAGLSSGGVGADLGVEVTHALDLLVGGPGAGLRVPTVLARLELQVGTDAVYLRALMRLSARAELGPVSLTVTGAGAWVGRWTSGTAGLLPPTGIGVALDSGPVSGGGFLARLGPRVHGGALSLRILGIGAFAWGVLEELPDGATSVVLLIGIRLPVPGLQVGFGFAVSGFGGLVGAHRRADLDRLREKLGDGTSGDVLFTDDPVRHAPRLLGELGTLFPAARGSHVVGPTLQLNWLYLLRLDLGLFLEVPSGKVFVAGTGRYVVGTEDFALVRLRLDFVGGVDPTQELLFFDGHLVDSTVLGIIRITGGIAFRLGVGASPFFVYSVGGFHPGFDARGLTVPALPRAGASVSLGVVWLRQEMYLAVTSTSYQLGTRTEAGIRIGPIKVHGWVQFDALIQLKPFFFTARIDAGMAAEFAGVEFASIRVLGELSGPGPLVLHARGSVRVLVKVSKSVTITLDSSPPEHLETITNLARHLEGELSRQENLRAEGTDPEVELAPGAADPTLAVPVGALVWEQKRVPLQQLLERAEGQPLSPARTLHVEVAGWQTTPEHDRFSHGTFADLSDAHQLATPTFVEAISGFRVGVGGEFEPAGDREPAPLTTDVIRLPERQSFLGRAARLSTDRLATLVERAQGPALAAQEPQVGVVAEPWRVGERTLDGFGMPFTAASASSTARHAGLVAAAASSPVVSLTGVFDG